MRHRRDDPARARHPLDHGDLAQVVRGEHDLVLAVPVQVGDATLPWPQFFAPRRPPGWSRAKSCCAVPSGHVGLGPAAAGLALDQVDAPVGVAGDREVDVAVAVEVALAREPGGRLARTRVIDGEPVRDGADRPWRSARRNRGSARTTCGCTVPGARRPLTWLTPMAPYLPFPSMLSTGMIWNDSPRPLAITCLVKRRPTAGTAPPWVSNQTNDTSVRPTGRNGGVSAGSVSA